MSRLAHDLRNQLAVAVLNVEAFADGTLAPTPDRLQTVLDALARVDAMLDELDKAVAARSERGTT